LKKVTVFEKKFQAGGAEVKEELLCINPAKCSVPGKVCDSKSFNLIPEVSKLHNVFETSFDCSASELKSLFTKS
jgi:hypothetical protein